MLGIRRSETTTTKHWFIFSEYLKRIKRKFVFIVNNINWKKKKKESPVWRKMGHNRESFRSKAAGFVSDLTTVILNPISDEPSRPTKDESGVKIQEPIEEDMDPGVPDGPDTSSFTAFVKSFLASSESSSQTNEEHSESAQTSETDLASENNKLLEGEV
ncbi:hypothetical protein QJS10_CPA09g00557 [Acorus calamus]|uniref:Uncharacterized protein n=1 Tax=Acorus calamus TaxID=4465 RepID=A0AAV9E9E0_ACOCL|nr:hypothetical protein QJS10_CPA09g00557 [Acorus calamus]